MLGVSRALWAFGTCPEAKGRHWGAGGLAFVCLSPSGIVNSTERSLVCTEPPVPTKKPVFKK